MSGRFQALAGNGIVRVNLSKCLKSVFLCVGFDFKVLV